MNLNRKELARSLINRAPTPSVSIFMPVAGPIPEARQNPIRLRNLIRESATKLSQLGLAPTEIDSLSLPAVQLNNDPDFWRGRTAGLAVYMNSEEILHYRLPYPTEEIAIVGTRWHLKPLMPLLAGSETFYILALSKNHVRFLEATNHGWSEIDLPMVAAGMKEMLGSDRFERELQLHSAGPSRVGGRDAQFYGTGSTSNDDKDLLREFLLDVDRVVVGKLHDQHAPLVLAGVDYVTAMFRQVSEYPDVVEHSISGSPDLESSESLHGKAVTAVASVLESNYREDSEKLRALVGTRDRNASVNLNEILIAAEAGRVATLFVALDTRVWGHTAESPVEIAANENDQSTNDLLDLAALYTLANSGKVYAVPSASMPGHLSIAACMRF